MIDRYKLVGLGLAMASVMACGGGGGGGGGGIDASAANFCVGTAVAGTCAQAFFAQAASCFGDPPPGTCQSQQSASPQGFAWCYSDGSRVYAYQSQSGGDAGTISASVSWLNANGSTCMTATADGTEDHPVITFHQGGASLVYDPTDGAVTCPDGSHANIGADGSANSCASLTEFVDAPQNCSDGTCALPPQS